MSYCHYSVRKGYRKNGKEDRNYPLAEDQMDKKRAMETGLYSGLLGVYDYTPGN